MINPMIFYWINFISNLGLLLTIILILLLVSLLGTLIYQQMMQNDYGADDEDVVRIKILNKKLIITTLAVMLVSIPIPDEKTMYKMLIASYVTEENYDNAKEEVVELIDYIAEKFNGGESE